jgi:hypothetical protein
MQVCEGQDKDALLQLTGEVGQSRQLGVIGPDNVNLDWLLRRTYTAHCLPVFIGLSAPIRLPGDRAKRGLSGRYQRDFEYQLM